MSDTTKTLGIKLTLDVAEGAKITVVLENAETKAKKLADALANINRLETIKANLLDIEHTRYVNLEGVVYKANKAIEYGANNAIDLTKKAGEAVNKFNTFYKEQNILLNDIEKQLQRNQAIALKNTPFKPAPTSGITATASNVADSRGYNSDANQATLLQQRLAREEKLRQDFNASTERLDKEAETKRLAMAQKFSLEHSRILNQEIVAREIQYRRLFDLADKLANKPLEVSPASQAKTAFLIAQDEIAKASQAKLNEASALQTANAIRDAKQREEALAAIRNRAAEQAKANASLSNDAANSYKQETSKILTELERRMAMQRSIIANGINSTQTILLRAAQEEQRIKEALSAKLIDIESKLRSGLITASKATADRLREVNNAEAQLRANQSSASGAVKEHAEAHKSLALRLFEVIGLYRLFNLILNTTKNALLAIPKIGIELESTIASLTATTGSAAGRESVFTALRQEADRTGISISTLRETFKSFQASTSLAGETIQSTWHMFSNLNTVITALHLPADKANGIFLAMAQIFNKGKVQSEELVKQLGNLLPGAFASFAAANSKAVGGMFANTQDLIKQMKAGTVFAHDTVEKFTQYLADRFAPAFALASQGLNANLGKMQTSFTFLGEEIYKLSSGALIAVTHGLTNLANYLTAAIKGTNDFGKYVEIALDALTVALTVYTLRMTGAVLATNAWVVSLRTVGVAATVAAAASRGFAAVMAFLSANPYTLAIAGVAGLALAWSKMEEEGTKANKVVNDFLDAAKATAEAPKEVTLEFRVNADPVVAKGLEAAQALEDLKGRLEFLRSEGQSIIVSDGVAVDINDKIISVTNTLQDTYKALKKVKEEAKLKIEIEDTTQVSTAIEDISSKMEILALRAKGFTEQASKMQFELTHKGDIAQANKVLDAGEVIAKGSSTTTIDNAREAIRGINKEDYTPEQIRADEYVRIYNTANKVIENYKVALSAEGINNTKNTASVATSIAKSVIKEIENDAKAALAALKSEQTDIDNKARLHQIGMEEIYKRNLEVIKKSREVNLLSLDKQEAAVLNKSSMTPMTNASPANVTFIKAVERFASIIDSVSARTGVDKNLIKAVIQEESQGNTRAVSSAGAVGLGQLMPATAKRFGVTDRTNAEQSINAVGDYLSFLLKKFSGNVTLALAGYNAGEGKVTKYNNQVPPYAETQNYVKKVQKTYTGRDVANAVSDNADIQGIEDKRIQIEETTKQAIENEKTKLALAKEQQQITSDNLTTEVARAKGLKEEVTLREIDAKYLETEKILKADSNVYDLAQLRIIKESEKSTARLNELRDDYNKAQALDQSKEQLLNISREAKLITEKQSFTAILDSKKELVAVEQKLLEGLDKEIKAGHATTDNLEEQVLLRNKIAEGKAQSVLAGNNIRADTVANSTSGPLRDFDVLTRQRDDNQKALDAAMADEIARTATTAEEKLAIEKKYETTAQVARYGYYSGVAGIAASSFDDITSSMIKMYGAQSKQARIAFTASKAMHIAQAVMSTAAGVTAQLSAGPIIGLVLAGIVAAFGALQVAKIIATPMPAAHGGLDFVPKEQTYLLDKGERVLSPRQNKDLSNYLSSNTSSSNQGSKNNIRIINAIDPNLFNEYLGTGQGEETIMNIVKRNQAA